MESVACSCGTTARDESGALVHATACFVNDALPEQHPDTLTAWAIAEKLAEALRGFIDWAGTEAGKPYFDMGCEALALFDKRKKPEAVKRMEAALVLLEHDDHCTRCEGFKVRCDEARRLAVAAFPGPAATEEP